MYMMAGQDGAGKHNDTQYAPINTDGSLGIWSTTASFTGIRDVTQGFAANGYLYIMGGYADAGTSYNDVQYAKLNSNGAIASDSGCGTSWCFTNYMQGAVRAWGGAFYYGGNVCYVGGDNNVSGADNVVQCAPVNSNGTLGIFQQTTAFATNVHNNKCTAYDGFAYCQGQFGLPNYAWYAPISSIPRKATYSRLFDLDTNVLPTKLLANGSLSSTNSKIQVNHKMVATGSTTFGSATLTDSYILDSLITLAASERQYIQVSITLDDSGSAVFPDSSVTQTTITDLLLYYRPAPAKRLRGGKTFTGEQNRGLDAQP
jgi:hypothetical protein